MTRILHLETTTKTCSVALSENNKLTALEETHGVYTHAENITVFIERVLQKSGFKLSDLHAVCVSKGPGSYMGLRIGTATAKGLCYAFDIPLIAVDTLQAMAFKASVTNPNMDALFCPMIDARRMEVYCALYGKKNSMITPPAAVIIDDSSFQDILKKTPVCFFGNGADKCESILKLSENARFLPDYCMSADALIDLAYHKYANGNFEDVAYFEPFYLKDFVPGIPKVKGLQ